MFFGITDSCFRRELPFFWEKTEPICLALVGLTAGWPADEMRVEIEIFKILYKVNYFVFGLLLLLITMQCYNSVSNPFQSTFFIIMLILRHVFKYEKFSSHIFSYWSLLLSTTVLNDNYFVKPVNHK